MGGSFLPGCGSQRRGAGQWQAGRNEKPRPSDRAGRYLPGWRGSVVPADLHTDTDGRVVGELRAQRPDGGGCIADPGVVDAGRDREVLVLVARADGDAELAAGGAEVRNRGDRVAVLIGHRE